MAEAARDYLLFRLYAGLASWGDIAVGEVRPSFERPSKSALVGLLAAALGVRRHEEEAQRRLAEDYGFAVEVCRFGQPLRDYHTVQRPPQRKGADYRSRREELTALPRESLATTLSYRDYWQDALYTACFWAKAETPAYSLAALADALRRPRFTLYLGRKSCPPALPLHPQIVTRASLGAAFAAARFPDGRWLADLDPADGVRYSEESRGGEELRLVRRDQPASRRRWQFADRVEYRQSLPLPEVRS